MIWFGFVGSEMFIRGGSRPRGGAGKGKGVRRRGHGKTAGEGWQRAAPQKGNTDAELIHTFNIKFEAMV